MLGIIRKSLNKWLFLLLWRIKMNKHKRLKLKKKYRDILNRIGAILVIVLTIVALLYIRTINIKNRIVTNYDQSWHIECADKTNMTTCLPVYED